MAGALDFKSNGSLDVRHAPFRIFAARIERRSPFCSSPFAVLMA
jgi:hypothetical protein